MSGFEPNSERTRHIAQQGNDASRHSSTRLTQGTLLLRRDRERASQMTSQFYAVLADAQWHTRRDLRQQLGIEDRVIRLITEQSRGAILSGAKGYKLTVQATIEEVNECVGRMRKGMEATGRHMMQILKVRARGHVGL